MRQRFLTLPTGKGHGWRRGLPDPVNDWPLSRKLGALKMRAPRNPMLNPKFFPRIRDQGELGSCTGHGLRSCLAYKFREKLGDKLAGKWGDKWDLSPLAMYWLGRREENAINEDTGCVIRDVVVAAREHGIPTEEAWPYDVAKFKRKPTQKAFKTGKWHQASPASYRCDEDGNRERTIDRMLQALAAGLPVTYGFSCYANLDGWAGRGVLPAPRGEMVGGHCVTAYWADTSERIFWGPNSWGNDIGGRALPGARHNERGYIGVPFDYFLQGLGDDAWAVDAEASSA